MRSVVAQRLCISVSIVRTDGSLDVLRNFFTGECLRHCLGNEDEPAKWDIPNFSACTSLEFRYLHEKVTARFLATPYNF